MTNNNTINKILDYKLKALKTSPKDTTDVEKMLRDMGISDPMEASIMRALLKTSMLKGKMKR